MQPEYRDADMTTIRLWSLSQDALVEMDRVAESLVVVTRWGEFDLSGAAPVVYESLRRMRLGPVSLQNATGVSHPAMNDQAAHVSGLAGLDNALEQLSGSVVHSLGLRDGQAPLLSVLPVVGSPEFGPGEISGTAPIRLSRFVTLRPDEDGFVLESPRSQFTVGLGQPVAVQVVAALSARSSIDDIAGQVVEVSRSVISDIVSYLVAAGVVLVGGDDLRFAEDTDPALRTWSHHELSFHRKSRTRMGEVGAESATERLAPTPAPVVKPRPRGKSVPLFRPTSDRSAVQEPSLTELLEIDHVCPEFSTEGLTADLLGELLFRAARVRSVGPAHLPLGTSHEATQRPYFNIACLYELELYLSVNRCSDLQRGIYHYDPLDHVLTLINKNAADLTEMLDMAKVAAGSTRAPSVLVSVTARMERTSWALGGAAYSTALMHLGALQQTLYLAAKSMRLSAHGVPVDDCDTVDRVLGLDRPGEIGIGECVLDRLA